MVTWDTVEKIKQQGVKLIVRLDNVPRNSRNRNTGTSRLKGFCDMADEVVWQCEWAKFYLQDFIKKEGVIIYNGVDTDIFKPDGAKIDFGNRADTYLFSRFNRDENKRWEEAWYKFQLIFRDNPNAKLVLVGNFSPEQQEYNFDFFRGEKVEYRGIIESPEEMARIYRGCGHLFATYYIDCYSNTYQEALACGCELYQPDMSGGAPELIKNGVITLEKMAKDYEALFLKIIDDKVRVHEGV
jgi:glycosyltransferase involved in cell wall biosynthesis